MNSATSSGLGGRPMRSSVTRRITSRIVFDPDQRVQNAVRRMLDQFDRSTSVRQLAIWFRDTETRFPLRRIGENAGRRWEFPGAKNLHKLLTHPIYAGVYTFRRCATRIEYLDGKLRKRVSKRQFPIGNSAGPRLLFPVP
jgi:hypothetical protein